MNSWLATQNNLQPEHTAFCFDGQSYSYGELTHEAKRRAAQLKELDIGPESTVGVMGKNSEHWVFWLHAILWRGAAIAPLHFRTTTGELRARLAHIDVDLLVVDDRSEVEPADTPVLEFGTISNDFDDTPQPAPISKGTVATILFTSGTTGEPKTVPLTIGNHDASARASKQRLGLFADDHWLCCLPLCHIGGLAIALRSVIYGTSFELTTDFEAHKITELLETRPITVASFVPTMLHRLLKHRQGPFDTDLRAALIGGGPISGDELRQARRQGLPVLPTFGMTEAASQLTTLAPDDGRQRLDTAGRPLDAVELSIRDEEGAQCEANTPGMVWARGPMISRDYVDESGWFCTGDVGALDSDGYLAIYHRATELIVTGGENVVPEEVEDVLRGAPNVKNAAVVGIDDDQWGQIVAAAVVANSTVPPDFTIELDRHCRRELAGFKIPRRWTIVDELPTTAAQKINKHSIRNTLSTESTP